MRTILYTGKGGVGKTTVSAATAVHAAKMGYKTLVISTDPAHSLADSLDMAVGDRPKQITENLWAQEINVLTDIKAYWDDLQTYMSGLLVTRGFDEIVAEELAIAPGMEEVCSLLHLNQQRIDGFFDCVILDMAPTGESLRLLSMPDVIDWYMEKIFPLIRKMANLARPFAQGNLIPPDNVFTSLENFFKQLEGVKHTLGDRDKTSVRLVVNPEKMVLKEAQRAFTYLNLFGYGIDAVVSNRIWPDDIAGGQFANWAVMQKKYREQIEQSFTPLPIWEAPLFDEEIVGLEALGRFAEHLFGDKNPTDVYYKETAQTITRVGDEYQLKLHLPFVEKEKFKLNKRGNDLIIDIHNFRREIVLPRVIAHLSPIGGGFHDGYLTVRFKAEESAPVTAPVS